MPANTPNTTGEDFPAQSPVALLSKVLDNEIAHAVARMVLFLILALAFIGTKKILSGAIHWAIPGEQSLLINVFDAIGELALIAAAIIVTCCGVVEVGWVVVRSTWSSTVGAKCKKGSCNNET